MHLLLCIPKRYLDEALRLRREALPLLHKQLAEASAVATYIDRPELRAALQLLHVARR